MATLASTTPSLSGLQSLPTELFINVLKKLPSWRDVLNARQICYDFYSASKSKEIWTAFIVEHSEMTAVPYACLEKPIQLYTGAELEHRFLRWMKTEINWINGPTDTFSFQSVKYKPQIWEFHTLKGGKWALIYGTSGLAYYNCEDINSKPITLIPFNERKPCLSLQEDYSSSLLSFNIALAYFERTNHGHHQPTDKVPDSWIDIWHGSLVLDDLDQDVKITVNHLTRVPICYYAGGNERSPSFSLWGNHVAFDTVLDEFSGVKHAIIHDWQDANSYTNYTRKNITIGTSTWKVLNVQLLPNNRIILRNYFSLLIFNYTSIPFTNGSNPYSSDATPLTIQHEPILKIIFSDIPHLHSLDCHFSKPFIRPDCIRFVLSNRLNIYGLTLRNINDSEGSIIWEVTWFLQWPGYSDLPESFDFYHYNLVPHLTYHHAVVKPTLSHIVFGRFRWPEEKLDQAQEPKTVIRAVSMDKLLEDHWQLSMDITTGRIFNFDY